MNKTSKIEFPFYLVLIFCLVIVCIKLIRLESPSDIICIIFSIPTIYYSKKLKEEKSLGNICLAVLSLSLTAFFFYKFLIGVF